MNILFFQNCISPHQMPYIKYLPSLPEVNDVVVVVPEIDMYSRKLMGWDASELMKTSGIEFFVAPSDKEVKTLYSNYTDKDTWCIYSGINSFATVTPWFRMSLEYNVKRGVITEPPLIYNHPLWQHALRFALKDWHYVRYIDKLFVMGDEFISYYRFWSKRWNVVPFIYCTEWIDRTDPLPSRKESQPIKILYVGALSHRKNVRLLLKAMQMLNREEQKSLEIGILGDGEQLEELKNMLKVKDTHSKVIFHGIQPMAKIPKFMEQYDILCLPSLHDGWGAVINEALTLGLYVICSDHCGSKYLITSGNGSVTCGEIFKSDNAYSLMNILKDCITHKDEIYDGMTERIKWAKENIKGEVVATYFLENLKA